jgi:long-chain acyl-CoA synthetase
VAVGRAKNEYCQRALREGRDPEGSVPPGVELAYRLAEQTVLRKLREKLGLDRVRFAITGAAPISKDVIDYFQSIGVPLVEGYGQTESTAIISVNPPGRSPLGTVGLPMATLELRIDDDGEILVKSPGVMLGYYKEPEATRATIDEDGFLHTGDVGELDASGRLRITDRKKDLIITSGGKNIAPQYIESKLRTSAYVHDAVVIGERRKFVTALVILDEDNLVEWAQKNRVQFGAYAELSRSPEVGKLIEAEVDKVNQTLTHVEAIKKFRILERRLDRDEGELTPTLKVRRKIVEEKYKALIDEMYRSG